MVLPARLAGRFERADFGGVDAYGVFAVLRPCHPHEADHAGNAHHAVCREYSAPGLAFAQLVGDVPCDRPDERAERDDGGQGDSPRRGLGMVAAVAVGASVGRWRAAVGHVVQGTGQGSTVTLCAVQALTQRTPGAAGAGRRARGSLCTAYLRGDSLLGGRGTGRGGRGRRGGGLGGLADVERVAGRDGGYRAELFGHDFGIAG